MDRERVYKTIDEDVSLIECNYYKGCIPNIDFTTDYYLSKIRADNAYKVCHLSSILFDIGRINCSDSKLLNQIRIWQCLGLSNFYQALLKIENSKEIPNCLVIQDFDEACNIAYFENHKLTIKLMHNILRIIRKLSQHNDTTCILVHSRSRANYVVRHLEHAVRNMVDNYILFDSEEVKIDRVYE